MPSVVDRLKIAPSPDQKMSSTQELSDESASFRRHFEQIWGAEHAKNKLIEVIEFSVPRAALTTAL